jgi:DDE_Tnp_1-associated
MGVNAYDPSGSVPAPTSSRVPTAPQRPVAPVALALAQCRDLLGYLATITDPRQRRGRRHTLAAVLAVAVAAVLAGARSLAAIGEWAADAPGPVLAALGVRRDPLRRVWRPPDEATVRRVLARVDPDALDLAIGRWLADQDQPRPSQPHSARRRRGAGRSRLTARRSAAPDATAARCTCWRRWTTLAARCWPNARSTAPLAKFPASSRCWPTSTWPAWWSPPPPLQTHPDAACFLVTAKQAHYLFTVKATSPSCWTAALVWPGTWSPSWTAPATAPTAASSCAPSRLSPSTLRLPPRRPGRPGHPQAHRRRLARQHPASPVADRDHLCDHQRWLRPGQPCPTRRPPAWPLGDRDLSSRLRLWDVTVEGFGEAGVDAGGAASGSCQSVAELVDLLGRSEQDPPVRGAGLLPPGEQSVTEPVAERAGGAAQMGGQLG